MSEYLNYCITDQDKEIALAVDELGNPSKAAKALGLPERTCRRRWRAIKIRAAKGGYSPEHGMIHKAAPGYAVKGTSTLYKEGEPVIQWVKTNQDAMQIEAAMRESIEAFASEIPKCKPVKIQNGQAYMKDLLNQYTITDFHLGMLAWSDETGADWDTEIAEKLIIDWFAMAISLSPKSETAVFAQIGDFLHWDGMDAVTPASGHILDADTRFQKLVRVCIRVLRRVINMLLDKHKLVHVLMCDANHDPASSVWMREGLYSFYSDESRVTVDCSPSPYYCYEFGKNALFYHHGHKRKVANIDTVFAGMFREEFGRSKYAYAHMGHLHSVDVKETNLMIVEQHRTLAAPDAYAARGGWISGRDAKVITYHREFGEVGRLTISPDMVNK